MMDRPTERLTPQQAEKGLPLCRLVYTVDIKRRKMKTKRSEPGLCQLKIENRSVE